jgi:hypothetical protein
MLLSFKASFWFPEKQIILKNFGDFKIILSWGKGTRK